MGYKVNKRFSLLSLPPSATKARYAYPVLIFVMIIAQVNLIFVVTPIEQGRLQDFFQGVTEIPLGVAKKI